MFSLVTKSTSTIYIEKFRASECWKLLIFIGESISSEYDQANIQIGPLNSKTFCSIICTICTYKYVLNGETNKEKEEERRKKKSIVTNGITSFFRTISPDSFRRSQSPLEYVLYEYL